ncbi:hypothetical protein [Variovorax paradoxus]|uniref:hypothetical protein n=1 Tax=Variovorax paradoxus TaxID=34073 RepID=UPI0012D4518F|nr:hypothetical protein [Variovorax paradoxus]
MALLLAAALVSCGGGGGGSGGGGTSGLPVGQSLSSPQAANKDAAEDPTGVQGLSAGPADSSGGIAALQAQGVDVASALAGRAASEGVSVYRTLDTSAFGMPRTMVYDSVHGDIYASYPTTYESVGLSAIVRFRSNGMGWTSTSLSLPGLQDIALAPDASVLAATDGSNHVHLIDLATFSVKSTHLAPFGIGDQGSNTEVAIAFTGDGRLWMPSGAGYNWHNLGFFEPRTQTFGTVACSMCYGGPYFAVSGDGSRLMVTQTAGLSPMPPMLYMDGGDGVLRTNPIGLEFFYWMTSLSDDGNRFLFSGSAVYDRAFGTVGNLPQVNDLRTARLSPDGRRAYTLNYVVEPGSSALPVVRAFDTTAPAGTNINLPPVGSFTLADFPACQASTYPKYSCYRPRMQVSKDGTTLMILGDKKLIVATIPKALRRY